VQASFHDRLRRAMGGHAVLPVQGVRCVCDEAVPPEIRSLQATFLPEGRPPQEQDVLTFLQQVLVHGWAQKAWAEVDRAAGPPQLALHLVLYPPVKSVDLEVPPAWRDRVLASLSSRVPLGARFNPEAFGQALSEVIYGLVMDDAPLVDARGSGFDPATGRVRVVLREPRVASVKVEPSEGRPVDAASLEHLLAPLAHGPLRTDVLQKRVALAEYRTHLQRLRSQLVPADVALDTADLVVTPMPLPRHRVDLSLGYESNLGGQGGLVYRGLDLGFRGTELELRAARNRLQEQASLALRWPVGLAPGTGLEVRFGGWRQRIVDPVAWARPELQGGQPDSRMGVFDADLRAFVRFGNLGTGKATLDLIRRSAGFLEQGQSRSRRENAAVLGGEWDNFDHHTLPRQGLLLRGRYGLGTSESDFDPGGTFRQGYLRARGLQTFGEHVGGDLDLEWGYGENLPLDRWWAVGGPDFVLGSTTLAFLTPNFAAARIGLPVRFDAGLGLTLE
ncbi:MAG TPA: hypothetical protein VF804_15950, partial [Holophagaceae bacterium]